MNWITNFLFYISFWFWGFLILNKYVKPELSMPNQLSQDLMLAVKIVMWTFTWIWFCTIIKL